MVTLAVSPHAMQRLRRLWLGSSLAAALACTQLFAPAPALAQDGGALVEPVATGTASEAAGEQVGDQAAAPAADPAAAPAVDPTVDPTVDPSVDPSVDPTVDPAAVTATTWYVNGSSGADGNCNTPAAPCRTIQAAIERAASGDTILVAGNSSIVYTFAAASPCTNGLGANVVACVANKKLVMRGGFAPGDYNTYAPAQNVTIIDGQGRNRGIAVLGFGNPGGTALDIAGFTVRNGYGTGISKRSGPDNYFGFGGGMLVEEVSGITLRDMVFDSNKAVGNDRSSGEGGAGAGGGLSTRAATALLENVLFQNNQALGGAGQTRGGFAQGGALFTYQTTFTGNNVRFENNVARAGSTSSAGQAGGDQRADGLGGAAAFMQQCTVTLNGVVARGNQAIGGNAGTYAGGAFGGAIFGEEAQVNINGAEIVSNVAQGGTGENGWIGSGGGIMTIHSTLNVNRARVIGNTGQGGNGRSGKWGVPNGGGITVSWVTPGKSSRFTLTNSFIAGNRANRGEGDQIEYGGGGGLWIQATEATLDHNTIADNRLGAGQGLYGQGVLLMSTGGTGASVTFRNNLITGHDQNNLGSAVEVFRGNTATFAGGLFFSNTWNVSQDNPNMGSNIGTINGVNTMGTADPLYVSPGASNYDYHIRESSPARNKAGGSQQPVDIDNQPRSDGSPDYGADEYGASGGGGGGSQGLPPGRVKLFMPKIGR